jgi:hypothetical protein
MRSTASSWSIARRTNSSRVIFMALAVCTCTTAQNGCAGAKYSSSSH